MSSTESPSLYPGYVAAGRFATVDDQHQSASTYILTILCVVYSGLVLFLRGHLRWGVFGIDDYLAAAATILQLGEVAAILIALRYGVGTSFDLLPAQSLNSASEATYAGNILFVMATGLAKCSVVFLVMRLFNLTGLRANNNSSARLYRMLCFGAVGFMSMWIIGATLGLAVNCSASTFIDPSISVQTCPGQARRWKIIMALDIITELFVVLLAVAIVMPLRLSATMKLPVILAFGFRLPCVALSILHFHYVRYYVHDNLHGMRLVPVLNLMQVQLAWSLMSATIPNLKGFVRSFNSGFGLGLDLDIAYGGSGGYGGHTNYELSRMGKSVSPTQNNSHLETEGNEIVTDNDNANGHHVVSDFSAPVQDDLDSSRKNTLSMHDQEGSIASVGSQEQIIRKDIQWRVTYEENHAR